MLAASLELSWNPRRPRDKETSLMRPFIACLALYVIGNLVIGCDSKDPGAQASSESTPKAETKTPATPKGDIAVVETNLGTIKFALLDNLAPKTVANFEKLADQKFYDGTAFHRV